MFGYSPVILLDCTAAICVDLTVSALLMAFIEIVMPSGRVCLFCLFVYFKRKTTRCHSSKETAKCTTYIVVQENLFGN